MCARFALFTIILISSLLLPDLTLAQQKPAAIAPAEKLEEGWEEIDQRLIFLMVRLANVEASLDAVEKAISADTRKKTVKKAESKKADLENEAMDRKGGGPMKWSAFYGTMAEKFFYHPTDRNSTYHTVTVLSQQGPRADNKVGGGVPAGQGVPVHQRPPQFDYIYRSNEKAKERAENEAAEFKGKIDELVKRRQRLEAEQSGLWCEVAFRAVSHYDLDKKPLYRFEPLLVGPDTESRQHVETVKAAASFMALAISIIDEAQKDQATTFNKIKPAISVARQRLNDGWLRLGVDATERQSMEGKFAALAKRLDDVASNLSESYVVANEGDQAKDQNRKDTFRGLLQESLVSYAQIILALDEMAGLMKNDWKIKPDVDKPIQFVSLTDVVPMRPANPKKTEGKSDSRHALEFDGSKSYGIVRSFRYDGTHPITVEAKVRPSKLAVSFPIGDSTGDNNGFNIQIDDKAWIFSVGSRNQRMTHVFAGGIERDKWVHVAGVFDGKNASIFLNGKLRQTKSLEGAFSPSKSPLLIGLKNLTDKQGKEKSFYFGGAIREVRLSNTARYTEDFAVPERIEADKDTLVFFPFQEGQGKMTSDTSGNKRDAELFSCGWMPMK